MSHEPPATMTLQFCTTCGKYRHDWPHGCHGGTVQTFTYDLRAEPEPPPKPKPEYERVAVAGLAVGDAIEWYLIVSNDGWEWVPGTVTALEPFTVRFWDDDVKVLRGGASGPTLRRRIVPAGPQS